MAKPTDCKKIENVKRATMELMIESGYKAITVSKIAKRAKVSPGYLYSHYESVNDLINELLENTYQSFIDFVLNTKIKSVRDFISAYVTGIVQIAMQEPLTVQFVSALLDDHAFFNERKKRNKDLGIEEYINRLLKLGYENYEIGRHIGSLEFGTIMIKLPFSYLYMRLMYENTHGAISEKDIGKLVRMMLNAVQ